MFCIALTVGSRLWAYAYSRALRFSSVGAEKLVYQAWRPGYFSGDIAMEVRQFDYFTGVDELVRKSTISGDSIQLYSFGWPDYSPQDKGITYTNGYWGTHLKDLDGNFSAGSGSYNSGSFFEYTDNLAGFVHRASHLNLYAEASVATTAIDFGNVIKGNTATRTVALENSGNQELEVTSVQASSGLEASLLNVRLAASGTETFFVKFDSNVAGMGKYTGSVDIESTADLGDQQILVTAFVDIDSDGDGIGNAIDLDDDNDGVNDNRDAYPLIALGGLADFDGDGIPDDCDAQCLALGMSADLDDDDDSMPDTLELENGLNPLDGSDCPAWFCATSRVYLYKIAAENADTDGDGLTNKREEELGTDKNDADSDADGLADGLEVDTHKIVALNPDSDGDGLSDGSEVNTYGTQPLKDDADGDYVSDGDEIQEGLDPTNGKDCPDWLCGGCRPWLYRITQ